jgi:hypothetical protein
MGKLMRHLKPEGVVPATTDILSAVVETLACGAGFLVCVIIVSSRTRGVVPATTSILECL